MSDKITFKAKLDGRDMIIKDEGYGAQLYAQLSKKEDGATKTLTPGNSMGVQVEGNDAFTEQLTHLTSITIETRDGAVLLLTAMRGDETVHALQDRISAAIALTRENDPMSDDDALAFLQDGDAEADFALPPSTSFMQEPSAQTEGAPPPGDTSASSAATALEKKNL